MRLTETLAGKIKLIQGKQPRPSDVYGDFVMFPDPIEQMRIREHTGQRLGRLLRDYPDVAALAVYDIVFALNDEVKASDLLKELAIRNTEVTILTSLYLTYRLRVKDEAPPQELARFADFCLEAGYDFKSSDGEKHAERLTRDRILYETIYEAVSAS